MMPATAFIPSASGRLTSATGLWISRFKTFYANAVMCGRRVGLYQAQRWVLVGPP